MTYRNILIFDLDETVIDSRHRTPNNPDGTLNLSAYMEKHTPENVAKDTLLPLARILKNAFGNGSYIVILTARDMKECDYEYLAANGIRFNKIMSRDKASATHYKLSDGEYKLRWIRNFLNLKQFAKLPAVMFDDAKPVKSTLRKLFPVLCAHKMNERLA